MKCNCYIIGDNPLLTQCIEILQYYNCKVLGVFTNDTKAKIWIKNHRINVFNTLRCLIKKTSLTKYDYLIVLNHDMQLPPLLIKSPQKKSIIFRNTLLKCSYKYAAAQLIWSGLHSNSVAWCKENNNNLKVNILQSHDIVIDEHETALTLNLKIYESALITFRNLVKNLSTIKGGNIVKLIEVNILYDITSNSKFINWQCSANKIYRLHRALQFGTHNNKIGLLMFLVGNVVFSPKELRIVKRNFQYKAGNITVISDNYLQISAAKDDIRIYSVLDSMGRTWSIQELVKRFNLVEGKPLSNTIKLFANDKFNYVDLIKNAYKNEDFWLDYLNNIASVKLIPSVTSQKKFNKNFDGKMQTKQEEISISDDILDFLKKIFNASNTEILMAIVLLYLYRINNSKKFSIKLYGTNRPLIGIAKEIFSNNIIVTYDFSNCESFQDILSYVKKESDMLAHHDYYRRDIFLRNPDLLDKLKRVKNYIALLSDSKEDFFANGGCYGFSIGEKSITFTYLSLFASDFRNKAFLSNVCSHIHALTKNIAKNPKKAIIKLPILSKSESYHIMEAWNATSKPYPKHKLIHELFEQQVLQTPNNIAAIFNDISLSYDELNKKANQLAHHLRNIGVQQESLVAIILERSLNMIISILGILKAGGAYVPVAPSYPIDRIQYTLSNNCGWAIVDTGVPKKTIAIAKKLVDIISLDNDIQIIANESTDNLHRITDSENITKNIAYVLYTSGTTGKPKGVQISHKSLVNHMCWMHDKFKFNEKDIVLQKTPFTFDASVWELFMPILVGGKLVFASHDAHTSPSQMVNEIKKYNVTTLQLVPSILRELLKVDHLQTCSSLRQIFSGGELLSSEIKRQFFQILHDKDLHNLYGPTETTIEVTSHTCVNTEDDINFNIIGKPIDNTKLYILDCNLEVVPIGVSGELYIGGDCLSVGYINNIKLTDEKFIPNKFLGHKTDKLYKTGDLARWLPDGNIEIIGRTDHQVKIRGFRIELNEVENNILLHPDVKQCAVIARKDSLGFDFLVAYIESCSKTRNINGDILKVFLEKKLPKYMIPSMFIFLEHLPLTFHGKVDRKNLPSPDMRQMRQSHNFVEPSTENEIKIAQIWKDILELKSIGIEDDFFSLGGHSLSVLQLLTRIENVFDVKISIQEFINNSTISKLSKLILSIRKNNDMLNNSSFSILKQEPANPIIPLKKGGNKSPLFLIHPVGGTIFWYITLAKLLDIGRPIYAIQDPGIKHKNIELQTIEDMASFYLKYIKQIQPNGAYLIGGASFGSTVAIEIANQLKVSNENTAFIPLLDGWAFYPDHLLDLEIFQETMERQYNALRAKFANSGITTNTKDLLNLQHYRLNMLWKYKMDKITQPLTLFKSQEILPVFKLIDAPDNHWNKYAVKSINIYSVPGNHETMFQLPNVQVLASKLATAISIINVN